MYHIIDEQFGYVIAELGLDQMIHPLHAKPMQSPEAAARLRADLNEGTCPLDVEPSPSGGWNPIQNAADAYDVALRIYPLLGKRKDGWQLALRIADARPWQSPVYGSDDLDQIPF